MQLPPFNLIQGQNHLYFIVMLHWYYHGKKKKQIFNVLALYDSGRRTNVSWIYETGTFNSYGYLPIVFSFHLVGNRSINDFFSNHMVL